MKTTSKSAEPFIATRNQHLSELAEDYVELIYDLIQEKNEARVCDIAERFGVSHVTVIRTLDRLKKRGLLAAKPQQPISLTPEGEELAMQCKLRHSFLLSYLIALGVPEKVAKIDVEGMEHHVSPATMKAFEKHLKILSL